MNFKERLTHIKAFAFDVDGVLSPNCIPLHITGEPLRMVNIKDGYAIHFAIKKQYPIAIITGGKSESVRIRFADLGVQDIYLGAHRKTKEFFEFLEKHQLTADQVLYVGDDIPDYEVMKLAGIAVAPADAAPQIKSIAHYVSDKNGGEGCGRDVIEQVLTAQGIWMSDEQAFGW